jgi:hypothetical protein
VIFRAGGGDEGAGIPLLLGLRRMGVRKKSDSHAIIKKRLCLRFLYDTHHGLVQKSGSSERQNQNSTIYQQNDTVLHRNCRKEFGFLQTESKILQSDTGTKFQILTSTAIFFIPSLFVPLAH